jgi:hypothetical protein
MHVTQLLSEAFLVAWQLAGILLGLLVCSFIAKAATAPWR